jgi:hypothetical protein
MGKDSNEARSEDGLSYWGGLLAPLREAFTSRSFELFSELVSAWVLAPARRTVTGMLAVMDEATRSAHDAYHRLLRVGAWSLEGCFEAVARSVVALAGEEKIVVLLDDTLVHKSGRNVEGAGVFRDAVRSTTKHVVYALGLNLVVLAVSVRLPLRQAVVALPVAVRVHHKGGPSLNAVATEMMGSLVGLFPDRAFVLCCDGAYASLAGAGIERTAVVSRMRRDAAIFEPPPPRSKKRGRPRQKGARLPTPSALSLELANEEFELVELDWRGKTVTRLVFSRLVVWQKVRPGVAVRLVIVRHPDDKEPDDYFFTTDQDMAPALVASVYASRWFIECVFRSVKQELGAGEAQTWREKGPERAAAVPFVLYSLVWAWYAKTHGTSPTWTSRPWYPNKAAVSFADALAELRRVLWHDRISVASGSGTLMAEITTLLVDALAIAA